MDIKKQMIKNAFKWREDMIIKQHNEMCDNALILFIYILAISHIYCIHYNLYENKKLIN
jgi:hypothetical protein